MQKKNKNKKSGKNKENFFTTLEFCVEVIISSWVHIPYLARLLPFQHLSSDPNPVATLSLQMRFGREVQYGLLSPSIILTSDT